MIIIIITTSTLSVPIQLQFNMKKQNFFSF